MVPPRHVGLRTRASHTRGSVAPDSHSLPSPLVPVALQAVCAAASDGRHEDFHRAQPSFQRCHLRCRRAAACLPTPRPREPICSDQQNRSYSYKSGFSLRSKSCSTAALAKSKSVRKRAYLAPQINVL